MAENKSSLKPVIRTTRKIEHVLSLRVKEIDRSIEITMFPISTSRTNERDAIDFSNISQSMISKSLAFELDVVQSRKIVKEKNEKKRKKKIEQCSHSLFFSFVGTLLSLREVSLKSLDIYTSAK